MRWLVTAAVCVLATASARADDWTVRRDPFDPAVVRRYEAVLAHDPHDGAALAHLLDLYRRYRTVAQLEAEYRKQLDAGDDWATLVVLARLPRGSRDDTAALWKRAVAAKPTDGLAWLAIGDVTIDAKAARDAYARAVELASAPAAKRAALVKLVGAARTAGDTATVDAAYAALIALAPTDGGLWLDRGDAQLAAKQPAAALASFARAEALLGTDPERRLTAMVDQALALDASGRSDDAIAQYERALDRVPSGYYLGQDIVAHMIGIDRRRGRLDAAIARLEQRWPERARGYAEWATLGDLYAERHADERAITAYQMAVIKAPTEVTTQRKLIALYDKLRPAAALGQLETAARFAPGDADLQLELARRYHDHQPAKAVATLDALARRLSGNVNVRAAIADLFERWNMPQPAIRQYEAIAALEPKDLEHAATLGQAYWSVGDHAKALVAWQRLDAIGTTAAFERHGDLLAQHDQWVDAVAAYTSAIALDGANTNALYGRARSHEHLGDLAAAIDDARRAVALVGLATRADGVRERGLLIRVLDKAAGNPAEHDALARWRFAFDHGDAAAGYLLAEQHAQVHSAQLETVLMQLYRLVPNDDSLGIAIAYSLEARAEFARARAQLVEVARRTPKRAAEVAKLITDIDAEQRTAEIEARWQEQGDTPPMPLVAPDLVGRHRRYGFRVEVGADVHAAAGALVGLGMYYTHPLATGTALVGRFDWQQRDEPMASVGTVALGAEIARRIVGVRRFELALAAGPRGEIRYGYPADSPWRRAALAADVALELLPRRLPAALDVRFVQNLTDPAKSSAVVVELGFEIR